MFITFEGPEGSGKTTQIPLLAHYLTERQYEVVTTRQPGGTRIGRQIRQVLHDVSNTELTSEAEILLYAADRAQHVGELIRPALAAGKIVLCDRYVDSTMAYQGYGRGLNLDDLGHITRFATGGLKPDLTFFLDIEVDAGLKRRSTGAVEMNRMDLQQAAFYERVYAGYQKLIAAEPERWICIAADHPVDQVQSDIRAAINRFLTGQSA